ncbi:hypothetical protein [Acinetobacter sp. CWB-B33]|uniref:hypothetical protein n=1 Tax=Acinetobacter sp. CWB-B33 TaxID=2815724 RepID=UPI0031FE9515
MEFCAIDWTELIKILTPFIIAFIVYRVWHNQKGKEVISNLAKEATINLLEALTTLTILTFKPPNDLENIEKLIDKFVELDHQNFRNLAFLAECLDDKELNELIKIFNKVSGKTAIRFELFTDPINHEGFITNAIPESLCREYGEVCEKLIDELKLYSTYRKTFKYK